MCVFGWIPNLELLTPVFWASKNKLNFGKCVRLIGQNRKHKQKEDKEGAAVKLKLTQLSFGLGYFVLVKKTKKTTLQIPGARGR